MPKTKPDSTKDLDTVISLFQRAKKGKALLEKEAKEAKTRSLKIHRIAGGVVLAILLAIYCQRDHQEMERIERINQLRKEAATCVSKGTMDIKSCVLRSIAPSTADPKELEEALQL